MNPYSAGRRGVTASKVKAAISGTKKTKEEMERAYQNHRQKLQELDLWLPELKKRLREFFEVSTNVKVIFLQIDDLYHLSEQIRPSWSITSIDFAKTFHCFLKSPQ